MIEALLVIVGVLLALPYLIAGMFWLAAATNGPRHRREAAMRGDIGVSDIGVFGDPVSIRKLSRTVLVAGA